MGRYASAESVWEGNVLFEALLVLFRVRATNTDVFYSGHSVMITLCALTLDSYCARRGVVAVFSAWSVAALYVIVATRFHYSIDVIVAAVLTVLAWKLYHVALRVEELRNYYAVFRWFESDCEVRADAELMTTSLLVRESDDGHDDGVVADADDAEEEKVVADADVCSFLSKSVTKSLDLP